MKTYTAPLGSGQFSMSYPDEWNIDATPVPGLVVPRQLCGLSNRPIKRTVDDVGTSRPTVGHLDDAAVFLWAYFQRAGDPDMHDTSTPPDYRRFTLPFDYSSSEALAAYDAREWDASQFIYRRLGVGRKDIRLSVWIWEGTHSSSADIDQLKKVVSSIEWR